MHNKKEKSCNGDSRRNFLKKTTAITMIALAPPALVKAGEFNEDIASFIEKTPLELTINGKVYKLTVDGEMSLLDMLREQLGLTGTKKGCDQGHCGACIVHVEGKSVNSCLSMAVENNGKKITTIEGLANGNQLHPVQEAFIKHDAFQCGYCTPGQIMSAVICIRGGHANSPEEIKEFMNGNICRCGAYPNIVDAITEVKNSGQKV
jgi:xanthine dehydrogenase YagT iron-sulfur-binding subunit